MTSEVHTRAGPDAEARAWQVCQCGYCGRIRECTPTFDFYGEEGELLKCEICFRVALASAAYKEIIQTSQMSNVILN